MFPKAPTALAFAIIVVATNFNLSSTMMVPSNVLQAEYAKNARWMIINTAFHAILTEAGKNQEQYAYVMHPEVLSLTEMLVYAIRL